MFGKKDRKPGKIATCPVCCMRPIDLRLKICEICYQKVNKQYPGGPNVQSISSPSSQETRLAKDEVACMNLISGCSFVGTRRKVAAHEQECDYCLVTCPKVDCSAARISWVNLQKHIRENHIIPEYEGTDGYSFSTHFNVDNFKRSDSFVAPVFTLQVDGHHFYVCRKMDIETATFLLYVVMDARPEVAKKYTVKFEFDNGTRSYPRPVLSILTNRDSINASQQWLGLPKGTLEAMWVFLGLDKEVMDTGSYQIDCTVHIQQDLRKSGGLKLRLGKAMEETKNIFKALF